MYTYDNENVVNLCHLGQIETPVCKLQKVWNVGGSVVGVVKTGQWGVKLDRWRGKKLGREKKKLDRRWKGEAGETIRFKHSKFANKYFRPIKKGWWWYFLLLRPAVVSGLGVSKTALWGGLSSNVWQYFVLVQHRSIQKSYWSGTINIYL